MNFNKMTLKLHIVEWVLNSKNQKDCNCKANMKTPTIDTHHIEKLI